MACTYNVDNFVNVPVPGQKLDSAIRIYNAAGQHTFSIEPYISYFTQGGNYVYIITQNNMKYQYSLDFCSETEANDALTKLNRVKKIYMDSNVPEEYYSKDHIDTTYYTRVQMGQLYFDKNYINANFLNKSGGTLNGNLTVIGNAKLSGLTLESGVTIYNISNDSGFTNSDDNSIATTKAIKDYISSHSGVTVDLTNYYTKSQTNANFLSANTSFYSKNEVYNTGETYSKVEIDSNFLSANTSFYSRNETDSNFLSANTSFYTQSQANANFLSANTSFYSKSEVYNTGQTYSKIEIDSNFLSANTSFYSRNETDSNFLSANTSFYSKNEVYNTGETYSKIEINSNFLSANTSFYTQSQANSNFLSANTSFYTQSQANANFLSANTSFYSKSEVYNTGETYSKIEVDSNFLSANTSFYTQSQANANFLSANTSFYTQSQANSNFLSANTSLNFVSKTGDTINGSLNIINNLNISGYTLLNTLKLQSGVTIYNISSDSGLTNYDDNTIQTTKSIKDYVDTKNKVNDAIQLSGDGIYTINLTESKFIRYITNSGLSLSVTGNTTDGNAGSVWFEVYNSGTTTITPIYNGIMNTNSYWLSIKPTSILTGETYIYSVTTYNISNNIFYRISGSKLGI